MSEHLKFADRCYRSGSALVAGVLMLGLAVWLGGDAVLRGEGRAPVTALAALLLVVPLVVAFTLRPAVYAGDERMRVRNPFRTITVPWGAVEAIQARYSCELVADGTTYQLWSIPVSLRARNRATRHNDRLARGEAPRGGPFSLSGFGGGAEAADEASEKTAPADAAVIELRELAERHGEEKAAQGPVAVRWAYEIMAPAVAGAVALVLLWITA